MRVDLNQAQDLTGELKFASYSALDTTGTLEIYQTLAPRLTPEQQRVYQWNLRQLAPSLAMTLRGVRVDTMARDRAKTALEKTQKQTAAAIAKMPAVAGIWDGWELETGFCGVGPAAPSGKRPRHQWPRPEKGAKPLPTAGMFCLRCLTPRRKPRLFEPGSQTQVKHLLYDLHKLPPVHDREGKWTSNDEALTQLARVESPRRYKGTSALCKALSEHRDLVKQLGFLGAKLSPAGRFHASFNVAAAWTGRWSSSKSPFQEGSNFQNIAEQHRHIFMADPGYSLFYADLKTAESLLVAYTSGDTGYIEAHKGDVHTYVCRLLWPEVAWTGDIGQDKKIAATTLPEWDPVQGHDLRFQSKRVQHGSNYGLSPYGMAMIAHIPVKVAYAAQQQYFTAFPMIREWQKSVGARVRSGLPLYNALQRVVWLMGRPWDEHTYKQGLAFGPQGGVGDILNIGLVRVWDSCDPHLVQVLAQVHDAILGQFPHQQRDPALAALRRLMRVEVPVTDIGGITRECVIPVEVAVGQNWGKAGPGNPNGMKEVA